MIAYTAKKNFFRGAHGDSHCMPHKARWGTRALAADDYSEAIQR